MKDDFFELLLDARVFRLGDFTLKDGSKSPYFFNFGEIARGDHLKRMGEAFASVIGSQVERTDALLGPPYKGISMAAVIATCMGETPFVTFRKESKAHGEGGDFLGHRLQSGDRLVLVDDVMTSGGTKFEAIEKIAQESRRLSLGTPAEIAAVVVGVDREAREGEQTASASFTQQTGVPVHSVLTMTEVAERVLDSEAIQKRLVAGDFPEHLRSSLEASCGR